MMNDIPPIDSAGQLVSMTPSRVPASRSQPPDEYPDDQLEISETGQLLSSLGAGAGIRADKVAEIRQAIADGTYETPDKLELTVDRLLEALQAMNASA